MKGYAWPGVALVAVLGALSIGLLALTDLTSGEVLGIIGVLAGIGGGAALAQSRDGAVEDKLSAVHSETQAQTGILETVERRTNGELDGRIEAAMIRAREDGAEQATAHVIEALRKEGVIGRG